MNWNSEKIVCGSSDIRGCYILRLLINCHFVFSALTLLVGWQEGHPALKNGGMVKVGTGWSRWSGAQQDGLCVCLC